MALPFEPVPDQPNQRNWDFLSRQFPLLAVQTAQPVVTALPTAPVNGMVVHYLADSTNGVVWTFKYRSASGSTYKWEFVGGAPLRGFVATNQGTTSATYASLATEGPDVTVPLAGDYDVMIGAGAANNTNNQEAFMSYAIGATAAVDADKVAWYDPGNPAVGKRVSVSGERRKTALAASTLLRAKYRAGGGTASFEDRWMRVTPVRVS